MFWGAGTARQLHNVIGTVFRDGRIGIKASNVDCKQRICHHSGLCELC